MDNQDKKVQKNDALWAAVSRGEVDGIAEIVVTGADVDFRGEGGVTPLMAAARSGRTDIMDILLRLDAGIDCQDDKGLTPAMWAAKASQPDALKLLLKAGADTGVRNADGKTVMTMARDSHDIPIYAILQAAEEGRLFAPRGEAGQDGAPTSRSRSKASQSRERDDRSGTPGSGVPRGLVLTLAALAVVAVASLLFLGFSGVGPLSAAQGLIKGNRAEMEAHRTLLYAVEYIEKVRHDKGAVPDHLPGAIKAVKGTWSYRALNEHRYVLSLTEKGRTYSYDSDEGLQAAFPELGSWGKAR